MLAYAAYEFSMMRVLDDGSTQRENCESYYRQTGEYYDGMEPVDCPVEARYLWGYWVSMSARRTSNGFGANPIPEDALQAWERRHNVILDRMENEAIDRVESLFLRSQSESAKAKKK